MSFFNFVLQSFYDLYVYKIIIILHEANKVLETANTSFSNGLKFLSFPIFILLHKNDIH